jgi:Na+/H+-dicarboxylate symporter
MKTSKNFWFYIIAISLGVLCGISEIGFLEQIGKYCAEIFSRIFKFISVPIVSLSVICALSSYDSDKSMVKVFKKAWFYTMTTTIVAASVSAILYIIISPANISVASAASPSLSGNYAKYAIEIIPDSLLRPFLEHNVLSVLLISAVIGISIRFIKESDAKNTVVLFFKGIQSVFFSITKIIVKIIPIGLFGFASVSVLEFKNGPNLSGLGSYFSVVVLSNLLQGVVCLPLLLVSKKINPLKTFNAMSKALSFAFFSKSSAATLPITIDAIETNLKVDAKISRFVLPLCTTINMNACAGFIFTTSVYMMQNYGITITPVTMVTWIFIATLAAIGNAGVPMGCYFMTVSLLSALDIPMPIMGVILPIYGLIDMEETALNVWSDSCVTVIVDKEMHAK